MGNKPVSNEIISTVRSIVGPEFTEMDILRALHMSNNDPTAAINIIFDTPKAFKKPQITKPTVSLKTEPSIVPCSVKKSVDRLTSDDSLKLDSSLKIGVGKGKDLGEIGEEWWFVGNGEVTGLSTCKGRVLNCGDEVSFGFPVEKKSPLSNGKFAGRGRQGGSGLEIVRFSTKDCGEVM